MKTEKHVTLVYVCPFKTWLLYPPLGIAFLASSLRENSYPVSVVDTTFQPEEMIYDCIERHNSALVGFSVLQSNHLQSLAIAKNIRARFPNLPIIFGGPFPTMLPEEIMKHDEADFVLRGEGENAIIEIMEYVQGERARTGIEGLCYKEKGGNVIVPPRTPTVDLDFIPPAAYDLLCMDSYLKVPMEMPIAGPGTTLSVTRGCYGNCIYCQPISRKLFGRGVRRCSPERVMDDIQHLVNQYKVRSILFCDDEPLWKGEKWGYEVSGLLQKSNLRLNLTMNSRVDTVNEPLLRALKQAGLKYLIFGVESGSNTILKNLRKGYTSDKIAPAFHLCRKLGIVSRANIMIGSPGESWETINETVKMLSVARPDVVSISVTTAIPGTDLYENLKSRLSPDALQTDVFDRKHVISITDNFFEIDIGAATKTIFNLFVKMTLLDLCLRMPRKWPLLKMIYKREHFFWRVNRSLPFRDIAFHLGYIKRTFV